MVEIPDSAPIFEEPPKRKFGSFCIHAGYTINSQQRRVTCNACGAVLDPFDIIERQAHRVAVSDDVESNIREKRKRLDELYKEEARVKARTRNARKKDADDAVAKALAKADENHERTIGALHMAISSVRDALRRLGDEAETREDGESWKDGKTA